MLRKGAATLGIRLWFEWVQSDQNPSDPLSRLGLEDPEVRAKLNKGTWRHTNLQCPGRRSYQGRLPCYNVGEEKRRSTTLEKEALAKFTSFRNANVDS